MDASPSERHGFGWFVAWMVVGAGCSLGLLSLLSIGVYVLAVTIAITIFVATRRGSTVGLPGLLSGFSVPLFYVAYLNRGGPGTVCTITASSQTCTEEWSPWPWLVIGIALLVGGVVWFVAAGRQRRAMAPLPTAPGA
ncbi:MAG TPA: hypothetical protein VK646_08620 [Actinomycetota bacterium]|nr:hypothetical protein [Actinomycetota bacterium]